MNEDIETVRGHKMNMMFQEMKEASSEDKKM